MSFNYESKRSLATKMISKYGSKTNIRIKRKSGTFDPINLVDNSFDTLIAVTGAVFTNKKSNQNNETLSKAKKVAMLTYDVEPKSDDVFEISGVDLNVIDIEELNINGVTILYKVFLG